jgi:hypothetical protein
MTTSALVRALELNDAELGNILDRAHALKMDVPHVDPVYNLPMASLMSAANAVVTSCEIFLALHERLYA